jgi:hypothetical protein
LKVNILQNGRVNLIKLLLDGIKIFHKDKRLIEMILHSLKCYIVLEEDEIMLDYDISLKNDMIENGLEEIVTNFLNDPNDNIRDIAAKILDMI